MSHTPSRLTTVRVWDLPTRAFHWLLALAVVGSVVSAKLGGGAMVWHFRFGYLIFALLAFRVLWGLIGGRWSRFASFIYAPDTLLRYLRGASRADEHHDVGEFDRHLEFVHAEPRDQDPRRGRGPAPARTCRRSDALPYGPLQPRWFSPFCC